MKRKAPPPRINLIHNFKIYMRIKLIRKAPPPPCQTSDEENAWGRSRAEQHNSTTTKHFKEACRSSWPNPIFELLRSVFFGKISWLNSLWQFFLGIPPSILSILTYYGPLTNISIKSYNRLKLTNQLDPWKTS